MQLNWGDESPFLRLCNKNCEFFRHVPKLKKAAIFLALCKSGPQQAYLLAFFHDGHRMNQF
jgi:hypothetical protein